MASNFNLLVILLVLYYLVFWDKDANPGFATDKQQAQLDKWIEISNYETRRLDEANLSTPLQELNLTGIFRANSSSNLNPFIPEQLASALEAIWNPEQNGSVYFSNVSSILHGNYVKHDDLPKVHFDIDQYNETLEDYKFKIGHGGKVSVTFAESLEHGKSSLVRTSIYFADYGEIILQGFYMPNGHIALASQSLKFAGVKALPWITPPSSGLEDAKELLSETLKNSTAELDYQDFATRLEESNQCEWVLYGHFHSSPLSQHEISDIEDELQNPQGRPISRVPEVNLKGLLYSPDCGIHLSVGVEGQRMELFKAHLRHALVYLLLLFLALDAVTIRQVQKTSTPTATYRISFWSIAISTLSDGLVCMTCMLATYEKAFALQLMAIVVVVFCFTTTVQLDYMVTIFQAQLSEGSSEHAAMNQAQVTTLIYSRLYLCLLFVCLLTVSSYNFKERNRKIYEWCLLGALYSNWWPQIYRNARKGFSQPFTLNFIFGVSALRVIPTLYLCFYPRNVGYHRYDPTLGWFILGWQWLQVLILCAQYTLGGQFFLPEMLVSDVYDYHPILNTDLEALLHTSELPIENPGEETGYKQVDCPICMHPVQLVVAQGSTSSAHSAATLLARRKYMVTPCRHVFHSDCLQEWMLRKLECPVCRTGLPST